MRQMQRFPLTCALPLVNTSAMLESAVNHPLPPFTFLTLSKLQGTYIDDKCPFVGNVSIRGRILKVRPRAC